MCLQNLARFCKEEVTRYSWYSWNYLESDDIDCPRWSNDSRVSLLRELCQWLPMTSNDIQWHPMICWFLCFHILPDCIRRQNLAQQANPWAASAIESILAWISLVSLSESWASLGRRLDPIFAFFLDSVLRLKDRFGGRASAGEGRVRDSPH